MGRSIISLNRFFFNLDILNLFKVAFFIHRIMPRYGLVRNEIGRDTNSFEDFREFENSVLADPEVVAIENGPITRRAYSIIFKLYRRLGRSLGLRPPFQLPNNSSFDWRIAILGGLAFRRCPNFVFNGKKAAYLFDSFEPWTSAENIKRFVEDAGISVLFVSHPDCADELDSLIETCRVYYIPEGADPDGYQADAPKTIDLIAFGRKNYPYHNALLKELDPKIVYQCGWLDTREDFLDALAASKIVINFPRNMTEDNCEIEMLTMRYFQAMGTKSILLGHCPKLLKDLCGYDPVIEVDMQNPGAQAQDILDNYEDYTPLIEKNYKSFIQGHTFSHRWNRMKQVLEETPS